jgi:hypothetical protein
MTPSTAMLDAVDRAFLWRADRARRHLAESVEPEALPVALWQSDSPQAETIRDHAPDGEAAPAWATASVLAPVLPIRTTAAPSELVVDPDADTLVDRLLRAVPQAWANLAQRVEDAHRDGAEVIAVTGARRGEGRTTMIECLARTLAARGRHVECRASVPLELSMPSASTGDRGGCIVLVDAGVWFPGGPFRKAWLVRQSIGCQAAILVRRADQPECAARGVALEAVGLKVLGEVLTMVPPSVSAIRISEGL